MLTCDLTKDWQTTTPDGWGVRVRTRMRMRMRVRVRRRGFPSHMDSKLTVLVELSIRSSVIIIAIIVSYHTFQKPSSIAQRPTPTPAALDKLVGRSGVLRIKNYGIK